MNAILTKEEKTFYNQQCRLTKEICKMHLLYLDNIKKQISCLKFKERFEKTNPEFAAKRQLLEEKLQQNDSLIQIVLSNMSPKNAWIIEKTYLSNNYNSEWYLDYFSKTTFYKRKREAIKEFVDLYFSN
ncbi:MG284/MPN403 family protein [Mycoplasmopsis gallinacea]|uniref:Uncharacterized protein n=1 Tax=Mycoplasmopsis gallinacea TaxID=29556 RepID=A0A449A3G1_9BACT|nr:hypothetical protein [Mycoplasmopsis gallinacea]VEU58777.1 Uncharacterised protein [Mycoplasmopsis gallinacea]